MNRTISSALIALSMAAPSWVSAAASLDWNGFGTVGVIRGSNSESIVGTAVTGYPYGNFDDDANAVLLSKIAVQATALFSEKLNGTLQVITRADEDYELELDWAYLRYEINEHLMVRAGRQRRHFFLNSDNYDVGYSYSWTSPPKTLHLDFGPFYDPIQSIDLYYQGELKGLDFSAQGYVGHQDGTLDWFGQDLDARERIASGLTLTFEGMSSQLHLGYHFSGFDITGLAQQDLIIGALTALGRADLAEPFSFEDRNAEFLSLGLSTSLNDWQLSAEYGQAYADNTTIPKAHAWYVNAS